MLTPEAIDKLGIKLDGSTVQAYTPPTYQPIKLKLKFPGLISILIHIPIWKTFLTPNLPGPISSQIHHTI